MVTSERAGIVYDAAAITRILGLPAECSDPAPEALDGETVVYYGGWTLQELRSSKAGRARMWDQDWYDSYGWKAGPGYYRLLLPVPGSNRKTWEQQRRHMRELDEAWEPAPVCIAATGLLAHLAATGNDLLRDDFCRCAEALPDGGHAVLTVYGGRVLVYDYWGGRRYDYLWLSAARKF